MALLERTLEVVWRATGSLLTAIEIVLFVVVIPTIAWLCGAGAMAGLLWVLYALIGAVGAAFGGC